MTNQFDHRSEFGNAGAPNLSPISSYSSASSSNCTHDVINELKSDIDVFRERGAEIRALSILDQAIGGVTHNPCHSLKTPGLTARQAANLRYEMQRAEKAKLKAKMMEDRRKFGKRVPVLVPPQKNEKLAESSRRRKPLTPDDVRDPETLTGMKCQLHLEREQKAREKALRLLEKGFNF